MGYEDRYTYGPGGMNEPETLIPEAPVAKVRIEPLADQSRDDGLERWGAVNATINATLAAIAREDQPTTPAELAQYEEEQSRDYLSGLAIQHLKNLIGRQAISIVCDLYEAHEQGKSLTAVFATWADTLAECRHLRGQGYSETAYGAIAELRRQNLNSFIEAHTAKAA